MITVWGEGRGLRVVWLLEEMGLPYRLRDVDLIAGAENDPEFLAINPAGFIPALQDGPVVMVESVAIMEYLIARHGAASAAPMTPPVESPAYGLYQQFLHLGEAGLMMPAYMHRITQFIAPEAERDNWTAREGLEIFNSRVALVARQLAQTPYLAGDSFTAADISVAYALQFARLNGVTLGDAETAYLARLHARPAYHRTLATCHATRGWYEQATAAASA